MSYKEQTLGALISVATWAVEPFGLSSQYICEHYRITEAWHGQVSTANSNEASMRPTINQTANVV